MMTTELLLPVCSKCNTVQYPPRDICCQCLNNALDIKPVDSSGKVIALTRLHISFDELFQDHTPLMVGLVKLDSGPVMYVLLCDAVSKTGALVKLISKSSRSGHKIYIAIDPEGDIEKQAEQFNYV